MNISRQRGISKNTKLAILVALFLVVLYGLICVAPFAKATHIPGLAHKDIPPADITTSGTATWLHRGAIKVTKGTGANKKTWAFIYHSTTGSTLRYALQGSGYCTAKSSAYVSKPYVYLSIELGSTTSATYRTLSTSTGSTETCESVDNGNISLGSSDNYKKLFWLNKKDNIVNVWHNGGGDGGQAKFKFRPMTSGDGFATGSYWKKAYVSEGDSGYCPDVIAYGNPPDDIGSDTWYFMPMESSEEAKEHPWNESEGSRSGQYARIFHPTDASLEGKAYFDLCRTSSSDVVNIYDVFYDEAKINGKSSEERWRIRAQVEDNTRVVPLKLCTGGTSTDRHIRPWMIDGENKYENLTKNLVTASNVRDEYAMEYYARPYKIWFSQGDDKDTGSGDIEIEKSGKWKSDRDIPGDRGVWVSSCGRTDDEGGDWAYHTVQLIDVSKKYPLGGESSNRLLYFNGANPDSLTYMGQGVSNSSGYRIIKGVAEITAADLGAASGQANNNDDQTEPGDTSGTSPDDYEPTCTIDGVGWIICPIFYFMAGLNDKAFEALQNILEVKPGLIDDPATTKAWENFRNIANALFVVAFLIIIYSQMTGTGLTNYGVKRMLPKMVAAVILVNVSYLLTALAADISNILGAGLKDFIVNISSGVGSGSSGANGWDKFVGIVLTGVIGIALFVMIVMAPMVLLAFAVILLILVARQALILMLIILSPLAFVAWLLPNTEQWFKKWWNLFFAMLVLYPMVAIVFGASQLASNVLMSVAASSGSEDQETLLSIVALSVMAIPLFAVPGMLKGAFAATGAIGAKLQGLSNRANGRAARNIKEGRLGEAKSAFDARRRQRKIDRRLGDGRLQNWGTDEKRAHTRRGKVAAWMGTRQQAFDQSAAGRYLGGDRGAAAAVFEGNKLNNDAVERSMALLENGPAGDTINRAHQQLLAANKSGDKIAARAATRVLASRTGGAGIDKLHDAINEIESTDGGLHSNVAESVKGEVNGAGLKGKDRALDKWSRNEPPTAGSTARSLAAHDASSATASGLNEAELAGHSAKQLRTMPIDKQNAQRVLDAHAKGTVHLDEAKLSIFQSKAT